MTTIQHEATEQEEYPLDELLDDEDDQTPLTEEERLQGVLSLLPFQDAPRTAKANLVIRRGPGRPRKVERGMQRSDLEYHAAMVQEKAKFIDADTIVKAIAARADAPELFRYIKYEIARETAAIQFQRLEHEKRGRDSAGLSKARIDALVKIANLETEARKLDGEFIDFHSERIQKVMAYWVDIMRQTFQEMLGEQMLPPDTVDLFFNRFLQKMDGWEDRLNDSIARRS